MVESVLAETALATAHLGRRDETLVTLVVRSTVEFLAADGSIRSTANAITQRKELERYCQAHELEMPDLIG